MRQQPGGERGAGQQRKNSVLSEINPVMGFSLKTSTHHKTKAQIKPQTTPKPPQNLMGTPLLMTQLPTEPLRTPPPPPLAPPGPTHPSSSLLSCSQKAPMPSQSSSLFSGLVALSAGGTRAASARGRAKQPPQPPKPPPRLPYSLMRASSVSGSIPGPAPPRAAPSPAPVPAAASAGPRRAARPPPGHREEAEVS